MAHCELAELQVADVGRVELEHAEVVDGVRVDLVARNLLVVLEDRFRSDRACDKITIMSPAAETKQRPAED